MDQATPTSSIPVLVPPFDGKASSKAFSWLRRSSVSARSSLQTIHNAKHFAKALKAQGLDVKGDPAIDYTETHQVIVGVGYGEGPEIAERLEKNNIIVNYQATPDEEGFTASGALRMGVSEMTRFGFGEKEFDRLAQLMAACILHNEDVSEDVSRLRADYTTMRFCFDDKDFENALEGFAGKIGF